MRKSKSRLVSFDKDVGLNGYDVLNNGTFTDISWFEIGKIRANVSSGSYSSTLKIITKYPYNSLVLISATIRISYTVSIFTNKDGSQLQLYTDSPINFGTILAELNQDASYYIIYFRPSIDFIGAFHEIVLLEEYGNLNYVTYELYPPQTSRKTYTKTVTAKFMPSNEFSVLIHDRNNWKNSNLSTLNNNTIFPDSAAYPMFTVSYTRNSSTVSDTIPNINYLDFSIMFIPQTYSTPIILDFWVMTNAGTSTSDNDTASSAYIINKVPTHPLARSMGSMFGKYFWYKRNPSNTNIITIYTNIPCTFNGMPVKIRFNSVCCNIVSNAGQSAASVSTTTLNPITLLPYA